jgi:hypothetical protein
MMRYMEEDEAVVASLTKSVRRVKIELNHTWNLRLLPVQIGADKMPYVRVAQHWRNNKPLHCPRHTPKSWGGDPERVCPVCELSERLSESGSEAVRDFGYQAKCVLRFRFWCVVFDKEDQRGRIEEMPWNEIINPYEFDMYKTTWEDFKKWQRWATTRRKNASDWGIMDLEAGCNVLATHTTKGVKLDRNDPGPIFDLEGQALDDAIAKVWTRIRKPVIPMPTEKQLVEMSVKFEEDSEGGGRGRSRRSRDEDDDSRGGRFRGRREGDDEGYGRARRSGGDEGAGRGRYRGDDDEEPVRGQRSRYTGEDEDESSPPNNGRRRYAGEDESGTEPATRRGSASAEAEADSTPLPPPRRREQPASARESGERAEADSTPLPPPRRREQPVTPEELDEDQIPGAEYPARNPVPTTRRAPPAEEADNTAVPPPPRRVAAPARDDSKPARASKEPPAEENTVAPPPPRRSAPPATGVSEEEDTAPEERRDPAPPLKEKVEDAPTPVSASAPAPARAVTESMLKNRLGRLTNRGQ